MPHVAYFVYPNTPGARFDIEYYNTTHFQLLESHWKHLGLESWSVTSFAGDASAPYVAMGTIVWKDEQSAKIAMTPENGFDKILGDIPNYTDIKPIAFAGPQTARSA
ncbi:hypothetical protein BKA62DRAFT_710807 [Auriculariales sp. MPI-PUGE-AT-0066]|nr:hypothetical protein BKA62DRAFT_710807 [Auriculariales sp. MPI-PUGE-AT-0066]